MDPTFLGLSEMQLQLTKRYRAQTFKNTPYNDPQVITYSMVHTRELV